jgi:hypothetical protein
MNVVIMLEKSVRQYSHGNGVPKAMFITLCNMERDSTTVDTTDILCNT